MPHTSNMFSILPSSSHSLCIVFLSIVLCLPIAHGKNPPKKTLSQTLYNNIATDTGISLRQAYNAVFKGEKVSRTRLYKYALLKGTKKIYQEFQAKVKKIHNNCRERKQQEEECQRQINNVWEQWRFVQKTQKEMKKDPSLRLFYSLLVLNHTIRTEVLQKHYNKWAAACSSQEKINTPKCNALFKQVDAIHEISTGLAQSAYMISKKRETSQKQKRRLSSLVKRHEI